MNKEIQLVRDFNQGWKEIKAKKIYGKPYGKLTKQQKLFIDDAVENDKE